MTDNSFTAISAMVLVLVAISARRGSNEQARRGRMLLLVALALFVGGTFYLNTYASRTLGSLWAVVFWIALAGWGFSIRDRGLIIIGIGFAILYFSVGILMPMLIR